MVVSLDSPGKDPESPEFPARVQLVEPVLFSRNVRGYGCWMMIDIFVLSG